MIYIIVFALVIIVLCIIAYLYSHHENMEKREAFICTEFSGWLNEKRKLKGTVKKCEEIVIQMRSQIIKQNQVIDKIARNVVHMRRSIITYNLTKKR